ncbi:AAA family ATPase [Vreelandella alkaliphila]|uniref:AAA family ATPase n=1 Tax=Vreelandella alkaliphila TaxID=272774 RepID=A0AAJ2S474_9GAMM|nr:AAA family ATPase [Halomonas alkaliphila]MDX5979576.1 AAA family ATPase [Halomonas alkaliphila]
MSVIQIRKSERSGARLVIGLAGISGSGKTYTALQVAWGLAGFDSSKVGLLDAENRRGSLYADALKDADGHVHQFMIGDLYPPFSPDRYAEAIHAFQKAGVEVLVVDSTTHEWEGSGGCEEIAHNTSSKMADWKKAKAAHKRFMNALLQTDMHIIPCIRAREKMDFTDPKKPKSLGVQPIQEKNFMFEMTASLMMWNEGTAQQVLKCPEELKPILGRGQGYLTAQDGYALRQWVEGASSNQTLDKWRNRLQSITEKGAKYVNDAWSKTPAKVREALGNDFYATITASAKAFDQQHRDEQIAKTGSGDVDDLNNMLGDDDSDANAGDDAVPEEDTPHHQDYPDDHADAAYQGAEGVNSDADMDAQADAQRQAETPEI